MPDGGPKSPAPVGSTNARNGYLVLWVRLDARQRGPRFRHPVSNLDAVPRLEIVIFYCSCDPPPPVARRGIDIRSQHPLHH